MLKRYSTNDGKEEKSLSPIKLSHLVDLREHSSDVKVASSIARKSKEDAEVENECSLFVLRPVVAHHGSSLHVGHYRTVIYINEDVMVTLDDSCIRQTSFFFLFFLSWKQTQFYICNFLKPFIAEIDIKSSGSGYERHLQFF